MHEQRIRDLFNRVFMEFTKIDLGFLQFRHCVKAFMEKHGTHQYHSSQIDFSFMHRQFGHSENTGSVRYGRDIFNFQTVSRDDMKRFEVVSDIWHGILENHAIYASTDTPAKPSRIATSREGVVKPQIVQNQQNVFIFPNKVQTINVAETKTVDGADSFMDVVDLVKKLRDSFNATSFLSPKQAEAVYKVYASEEDFLVVLPTGGGKTLVYLLPAMLEKKVTVVVVPLKALLTECVQGCLSRNISVIQWSRNTSYLDFYQRKIVFVTIEDAVTVDFKIFIRSLYNAGSLRRIVVDEVHCVKDWASFREKCIQLPSIRCVPVQLVLLTATLPPREENDVKIMFGSNFTTIRSTTIRPNIKYGVELVEDPFERVVEYVQFKRRDMEKVIVFCPSRDDVSAFQERMKLVNIVAIYYTSESHNELDIADKLQDAPIIFCTAALSMGVNIVDLTSVVHYNGYYSLSSYCQESGRVGRRGEKSTSVVILKKGNKVDCPYLKNTTQCRRAIMHLEMDRQETHCLWLNDAQLCDICEEQMYDCMKSSEETLTISSLRSLPSDLSLLISEEDVEVQPEPAPESQDMSLNDLPDCRKPTIFDSSLSEPAQKRLKISTQLFKVGEVTTHVDRNKKMVEDTQAVIGQILSYGKKLFINTD